MFMNEMKTILIACGSFALSAMVVGNAFYQKKQFYPSVVYITKSNPSLAVLYLQAFVFVFLMGKLFRKIFFGQLRAAEMEHLIERSWYAVTETCLAFTVFRDDFSPRFVAAFTLLLFLKCFHWLAEDRVDFMERSPIISFLFHIRVISLLTFLSLVDSYFVNFAYYSTLTKGASVQMVFGFEYAILMTIVMMTVMKYVLHSIDLQSENPWENKAVYLLYTELVLGFVKVILYIMFMIIMIKIHTFPLFAIRPMYLSVRNFKKALHDVIMSRRAIQQMNTLYPDVSAEELATGDNVCIICREDMVTACKKLPCNHIFHTSCLRSWFQRQQTCPTCRMEVLRMHTVPPARRHQQQQQQQQQPAAPPQFQPFPQPPPFAMFQQNGQIPPMWPPQMPQAQVPQGAQAAPPVQPVQVPPAGVNQGQAPPTSTQATPSSTSTPPTTSSTQAPPTGTMPGVPGATTLPNMPTFMPGGTTYPNMPFIPPMFPHMYMPTNFPRPMGLTNYQAPPVNLGSLTDEEVRALEGVERENTVARVRWLQDIQSLLDGAVLLIENYNIAAANSGIQGINMQGTDFYQTEADGQATNTGAVPPNNVPDRGARPKTQAPSQTAASSSSQQSATSSSAQPSAATSINRPRLSQENIYTDSSVVEGATGYTPTSDELIPEWHDPRKDEMDEVRRRRLEKFLSDSSAQSENKLSKDNEEDENS